VAVLGFGISWVWASNSCVECHQRAETVNALPAWYQDQFIHWYGSVHGRKGITCDKCHGGDPNQASKKQAHRGVKPPGDSKSRIHYRNLPETCGACHKGVYEQFIQSRHYQNLKADRLAPTCTTCHGFEMDIGGVEPLQIAGRCSMCHSPQRGIKPEVAELTRQIFDGAALTEQAIQKAQMVIELAKEQGQQPGDAERLIRMAQDRFRKTGELWHNFRLDAFKQELTEIQGMAKEAYYKARDAMQSK
jgi:hypothetical protein